MSIFIIAATAAVGFAQYWLMFKAPQIKAGKQVNFVLIESPEQRRLRENIERQKEEDAKAPWWFYVILFPIIFAAQLNFVYIGLPLLCLVVLIFGLKWADEEGIINLHRMVAWIYLKLFFPGWKLKKQQPK